MASESTTFGLATLGVIGGLAVLLYGVSLNNGEHLNGVILAGGVIILVAFTVLTAGVAGLDGGQGAGDGH